MLTAIAIDTHTHTVLSGHAWSTLRENIAFAVKRGLHGICLTEHGHAMPSSGPSFITAAQKMLPKLIDGVRLHLGVEANIVDFAGNLDVEDRMLDPCEWVIASIHDLTTRIGSVEENTAAMLGALANPKIDILGHIDDKKAPVHFDTVTRTAAQLGKLVEINNNSLLVRRGSRERMADVVKCCLRHGTRVAVASDAHFDAMIGDVGPALELLASLNFPDELVVNRSPDAFESYLAEREARLERAKSA